MLALQKSTIRVLSSEFDSFSGLEVAPETAKVVAATGLEVAPETASGTFRVVRTYLSFG